MENDNFSQTYPIYKGRAKDQYDPHPDEKVVQVRRCGQGCVIIIIEKQGLGAKLRGVFGKHQKVEPVFRPLDEIYMEDQILITGRVDLKANQRMVIRQGEKMFQTFPPTQNK